MQIYFVNLQESICRPDSQELTEVQCVMLSLCSSWRGALPCSLEWLRDTALKTNTTLSPAPQFRFHWLTSTPRNSHTQSSRWPQTPCNCVWLYAGINASRGSKGQWVIKTWLPEHSPCTPSVLTKGWKWKEGDLSAAWYCGSDFRKCVWMFLVWGN